MFVVVKVQNWIVVVGVASEWVQETFVEQGEMWTAVVVIEWAVVVGQKYSMMMDSLAKIGISR